MLPLTKEQTRVYHFIADFWRTNGYAPSYSEIGANLGKSKQRVNRMIEDMERRGVVQREYGRKPAIVSIKQI